MHLVMTQRYSHRYREILETVANDGSDVDVTRAFRHPDNYKDTQFSAYNVLYFLFLTLPIEIGPNTIEFNSFSTKKGVTIYSNQHLY